MSKKVVKKQANQEVVVDNKAQAIEQVIEKVKIKAHPRCEDAIHCEVCREEMGL